MVRAGVLIEAAALRLSVVVVTRERQFGVTGGPGRGFDAGVAARKPSVDPGVDRVTLSPGSWSDVCGWADIAVLLGGLGRVRGELDLGSEWSRRWTASWRYAGGAVSSPVRDLGVMPPVGCEPVRRFSWARGQRHRPGLQFLVSTGRHHGFESLAEARLLLALDFAGDLVEVLAQPFGCATARAGSRVTMCRTFWRSRGRADG
jgi:hypothetical protein